MLYIIKISNFIIFPYATFQSLKPVMERKRRARINASLAELKSLLIEVIKAEVSVAFIPHDKKFKVYMFHFRSLDYYSYIEIY